MNDIPHDELVAKINEFTKLSRERKKFRDEYLARIRSSMRSNLDGVEYKKK